MKRLWALVLSFFALVLAFGATPAYAQDAWFSHTVDSFGQVLEQSQQTEEVQKEGYDTATQVNSEIVLICQITGCSDNPQSTFYYGKSALATISNYMASMYLSPPADLALWIRDTGQTLGFIPRTAYAQGLGFTGLSPLLPIWKAFRNIAYLFLAIIMIAVGFMVMLRKKIDPKTVVTVQNALPRIVLTLILITFSYAIVGILIDLMYLFILLVVVVLGTARGFSATEIATLQAAYLTEGMSKVGWTLFAEGNKVIPSILQFVFGSPLAPGSAVGVAGLGTIGTAIAILLGASLANPATWLPLALTVGVGALFYLIFVVILLFSILRIFFMLLSAYINIIVSLLIGPLQILVDAIPGNSGFASWIANLMANILVFPATVGLLMLGSILASSGVGQLWSPPLLSEGAQGSYGLSGVIALGILLSIPTIVNRLKEAFKAKAAVSVTAGFGQSISSPAATVMQAASFLYYIKMLGGESIWSRFTGKKPAGPAAEAH